MQFVCYGFDKSHKYLGKLFSLVKSFPKPLQKHAWKRKKLKTLRLCLKLYKLFEKSLNKNFVLLSTNRIFKKHLKMF